MILGDKFKVVLSHFRDCIGLVLMYNVYVIPPPPPPPARCSEKPRHDTTTKVRISFRGRRCGKIIIQKRAVV